MSPNTNSPESGQISHPGVIAVVLIYALFGACWILLSDQLVQLLFDDPSQIILASMFKGWFYVLLTSLMLYNLIGRWVNGKASPKTGLAHSNLVLPFSALAIGIVVLVIAGVFLVFYQHKHTETLQLNTIADFKTQQITEWLAERQGDAVFVQTSDFFAEQFINWQVLKNAQSGDRLKNRLEQLLESRGFDAVTLFNAQGLNLWESSTAPTAPEYEIAGVKLAAIDHKIRQIGPYRTTHNLVYLDVVVPLANIPGPTYLMVLHLNLSERLLSKLRNWPVPNTSTGEINIFRTDAKQLVYINTLATPPNLSPSPLDKTQTLQAKILSGQPKPRQAIEGLDYRGIPSIAVIHGIPGTDWFLLAKRDQAELYAESLADTIWILLVGILALFITWVSFFLLRQRQELALALAVQKSQGERLYALMLLGKIADSSEDAIFAKDLQGRYILFNRAASEIVGKPVEDVLNRDDYTIFPQAQAESLIASDKRVIFENQALTLEEIIDTAHGQKVFLTTKGLLRDENNKILGTFGMSRDITEREQTKSALKASELNYRSLFENMINSVVHARILFSGDEPIDLEYLATNPAFAEVTGITEPVVGRKMSEVIPGYCQNNPESLAVFGRVASTGISTRWEHFLPELGRWFAFIIYSPTPGEVIIVSENITERKQAEINLANSEERLQLALEATNDGLWDWDLSKDLAYLTPHYYEMTGYQPDQIIPNFEFFKSTVHPDDLPEVIKNMEANMQGRTASSEFDYRLLTATGAIKWVKGKGRVVKRDAQGTPLRMVGVITDISASKATEQSLLRKTEELIQRNTELERFNRATVGRELEMIELKQQINELMGQLGQEPSYKLSFLNDDCP